MKGKLRIEYRVRLYESGTVEYGLVYPFVWESRRYKKRKTVPVVMVSDGATKAIDIPTAGWLIHDAICKKPYWDDGDPITALQAAVCLGDALAEERRYIRMVLWPVATFLFGCIKSRENGWA